VTAYRAEWVLPVPGAPIRRAGVTVDAGRIVSLDPEPCADAVDLGRVALLPGLINCHTHLELSYLRGRIPPAACFTDWVRPVLRARGELGDVRSPFVLAAARGAIAEARAAGTAAVGDITNTQVTAALLAESGMPALLFLELMGFTEPDPQARVAAARQAAAQAPVHADVRWTLAAHAPYSVSPALFTALRDDLDRQSFRVSAVHVAESPEEVALLATGHGGWRTLLEEMGLWTGAWVPPGRSPVAYLADLGFLQSEVLVVHGVQCDGADLARLRSLDATLVSCPRSNAWVGVGAPPLEAAYAAGVRVAFGTDSLASVADLNLFSELKAARALAPRVPARFLLESATRIGARALGMGELGGLEPGMRAALITVRLPEGVRDVEEYLVSGVTPDAVAWVPGAAAHATP